jgi:hypothetical protein
MERSAHWSKKGAQADQEKKISDRSSQVADPAELDRMIDLIFGFITSQAIAVAAELGVADLLKEEPKTDRVCPT